MASSTTNPNLITDLVALAMNIPPNASESMSDLKSLVLQLPGAAKTEREAAAKKIKSTTCERDQALNKLQVAEDEVQRLRLEVRAFENRAREGNRLKRKALVAGMVDGDAEVQRSEHGVEYRNETDSEQVPDVSRKWLWRKPTSDDAFRST